MTEREPDTLDYPTPGADSGGPIEIFQRNPQLTLWVGALFIVFVTFLAYLPAIRGDFIWDDDWYVTRNPLLTSLAGLQRVWFDILPSPRDYPLPQYYPMTHTSLWIEYKLFGANPLVFHVTNVMLHVANALLIWLLLRKLAVPGAWLAAAIFAIHPINVESVAWIAERKNVLSGFFFFASLYVYLRYAGVIAPPKTSDEYFSLPTEAGRVWGLAFALFFFALASKTIACSLPAVVLLVIWWKRGRISWDDVWPLVPFFVLGLLAGWLTGWMEVNRVGASGAEWQYGSNAFTDIVARWLIAGRALWFYAYKLLIPYPLMFNYPRWQISIANPLQWLYPLAAVAVIVVLWWYRKQIGRGPLVAVLYYAATLFPALGFFNVLPHRYSFVADHFVYLSSIGLIALAMALITWACVKYLPREAILAGGPAATAAAVLCVFLILSLVHANVFASMKSLWEHTVTSNKKSWFAANNYGVWIRDATGKLDEAEQWFHKVIELKPDHPEARYNLGVIAERRGNLKLAEEYYREALRLEPRYARAHYNLGQLMVQQGRKDEAMEQFRAAIALDPNRSDLSRNALGLLMLEQARAAQQSGDEELAKKKFQESIDQFIAALEANPEFVAARNHLAQALADTGRVQEAIAEWTTALDQDPRNSSILNNLGRLMAMLDRPEDAGRLFERAVQVNPNSLEARTNFGTAAAMIGRLDVAREQFEAALRIDPNYEFAKQKLADLEAGRLKPATTQATTQPATAPLSPG